MTDREKAIVQAYTGVVMLAGEKFDLFYKYLEELYDRPVYTHEIPFLDIKEKATPDFLKLCKEDTPAAEDWDRYSMKLWKEAYERGKRDAQPEVAIRCKDCKHRPIATRADEGVLWGWSVEFPDEICPLQCEDGWYNYYPKDDFYCANAERRTDE